MRVASGTQQPSTPDGRSQSVVVVGTAQRNEQSGRPVVRFSTKVKERDNHVEGQATNDNKQRRYDK